MRRTARVRRGGFTLLEVLLASALAVILMAALYVALEVQLQLANAGRESIEQATVTRALVLRFENDLAGCIGPGAPAVTGASTTATTGTGEADPAAAMAEPTDTISFQGGTIGEADGDNGRLTLYVSKVAGLGAAADSSTGAANPADVHRVTYWMTAKGLARQSIPWVTSERVQLSTEPYIEEGREANDYSIAEEVTQLKFSYWDGSQWTETWDGRQQNSAGTGITGPPMAIRVHFWMNVPGQDQPKEFRHTISVLAAPGTAVPETTGSGM